MFGCFFTTITDKIHQTNVFLRADLLDNTDADLLLKYQDRVVGWGVQLMTYLIKTLLKEAEDFLNKCGTDDHAALQSFHL